MERRNAVWIGLALLLSGCFGPRDEARISGSEFDVIFERVAAPQVFAWSGPAERAASGAPGLWAAVPDLPQAEMGAIRNPATGAEMNAVLFAAPPGVARISLAAADALGVEAESRTELEVVVLRSEPRLVAPKGAF